MLERKEDGTWLKYGQSNADVMDELRAAVSEYTDLTVKLDKTSDEMIEVRKMARQ